jgi:hypothetical protein
VSGQRCDVTELLVDQCACSDHRGGIEVTDELATVGQPFAAMYAGCCAACEGPIRPDQLIARLADDDGYVHAGRCPR